MFDEETESAAKPALRNLETMSRSDLADYIQELRAEITRVEIELKKKEAHANAASLFFKSSDGAP